MYFLECPCNSRTICTFCMDPICCQISIICHSSYFDQPPLWHSAHNTVHVVAMRHPSHWHTLMNFFLLDNHDTMEHHFMMFFIVFLPLFKFACLFFLVDCCDLWAHVHFWWGSHPCTVPSWTSFTWPHDACQFLSA